MIMELIMVGASAVQLVVLILQLRSRPGKVRMLLTMLVVLVGFLISISARL